MSMRLAYLAVLRMFGWLVLLARSDRAKPNLRLAGCAGQPSGLLKLFEPAGLFLVT